MGKNMAKNKSKILSSKYDQKLFDNPRQLATGALKTASRNIKKKKKKQKQKKLAEINICLIGNKIANEITKVSKNLAYNTLETVEKKTKKILII